jgi:exonuclease V gamma subunit
MLQDEDSGPGMIIHRPIPNEEDEQPVRIDDLLRFYNNPVRWFFRSRFEAYLREPDQESDEFSLDHLETHLLFQRVFGWVMNDMSDREIREYLMQSGSVPSGWAGEKELLDLKQNVETALSALREHGIIPAQNFYPVSLMIGKHQLDGSLTSYSQKKYVDISPSGYSGKAALSSWIGHLCAQASGLFEEKESILFSELKKGDPKVKRFRTVQDPSEALAEMVNFYKLGLREPQLFFPKTLYAYEEAIRAGKTEKAIDKAAGEFNNSDFKFGESSDLYIKTALGEDVEFRPEFIEDAHRKIIGRMMDHMEDG